ncbi:hypothetical protein GCM10029976_018930 [Kribbella albertanoniae]|uniref:Uncharacterized protein n=1 Tax=Kribbella albertanoniae TaxID=1266829 RepID=A0A4R4PPR5_9ACTN|nr:hypothetical protein [Kribbella albertanoniae]TDC24212.1 hypothetical protein E1261_26720 [Kribbella albertanoniae]
MVRRALALFATLLVVAALTTIPAAAGGPTSVLLSAPPHLVAFGYDDPQYAELQKLTSVDGTREDPGTEQHEVGAFVRATWLIHDMSVYRLDVIYPDAPGGPWIATTEVSDGSSTARPTWHRATDPVALVKLLSGLKLLPGLRNGEQPRGGPTGLSQSQPTTEPPAVTPSAAEITAPGFFTGWRWLLPGALLGALLTWAATRFLRQRRWDLIDAE